MRDLALILTLLLAGCGTMESPKATTSVRFATFNTALFFPEDGAITEALSGGGHEPARKIAAIIQRVRPDVLLLNEFDHDRGQRAVDIFVQQYLARGQYGENAIDFPYRFVAPVNTGLSTGVDLNGDGEIAPPDDAHGWGAFPGQYGMVVLSRLPLDNGSARTFQTFRWKDMPDPWWPRDPESGAHYYPPGAREVLRLSSKSHWDVPVLLPDGRRVHFLVSHPTPPVFDGPEDRNGRRNHDEIRFWRDYLDNAGYIYDDRGGGGGLEPEAAFVIAGDLNADPNDGDSSGNPMAMLLGHPRVAAGHVPTSRGAALESQRDGGANRTHRGDPAADTSDFPDADRGPGNMRIDYVLPSRDLGVVGTGVFWPLPGAPGADWIEASDHRLVWVDIAVAGGNFVGETRLPL